MDPITAAILAALSAEAIDGLTEASKTAITDAYSKLKMLLIKKFGSESQVIHAINEVEAKPNSDGRKMTLQEEMAVLRKWRGCSKLDGILRTERNRFHGNLHPIQMASF